MARLTSLREAAAKGYSELKKALEIRGDMVEPVLMKERPGSPISSVGYHMKICSGRPRYTQYYTSPSEALEVYERLAGTFGPTRIHVFEYTFKNRGPNLYPARLDTISPQTFRERANAQKTDSGKTNKEKILELNL